MEEWFPVLSRRKDGPWLVHRLDADTSGCLVIALRRSALRSAQREFAEGRARKTYWAVVVGAAGADAGVIDVPLNRRNSRDGWRMVADPHGREAVTEWRVLGRGEGLTWLELHPRTGRTHQVRVHCALSGWPVLGDPVYGGRSPPLHLLARAIELDVDPPVRAQADPPGHMLAALRQCGWARG